MSMELRGTTICAVRKNGHTSIAGDGQVTMGQSVIFKSHAHKVRRLYGGQVVIGFAGAVADAFTLCDKFEERLTQCGGNLERAAVALVQNTDLSAHDIAEKALHIAASICVFTNDNVIVEDV